MISGISPTFSTVVATTILASTMSLAFQPIQAEKVFDNATRHYPPSFSTTVGTAGAYIGSYPMKNSVLMELEAFVDRLFKEQMPPDTELDNIIANNLRNLYQYGFSE